MSITTNILKGFVSIQSLIDNTPGTVSPIGEISTWSLTYSRDKGEYTHTNISGYRLYSMRSIDNSGNSIPVSQSVVDLTIEVVRDAFTYSTNHIRPFPIDDLKNTLLADFYNKIGNVQIGSIVDTGVAALPEWISFNNLLNSNQYIKVWLSDNAFINQYDEYSITVIPPLSRLDNFFNNPGVVVQDLESVSISAMVDMIQAAKGDDPETYLRTLEFDYIAPNSSVTTHSYWNVLIYGIRGDNIDSIKEAIIEYVLSNSNHPRSDWEAILPSLFKRTEFIILPRWDHYSVPNLSVKSGLYGSITDPVESIEFATGQIPYYSNAWIQNNINILPYPYKSIILLIVNGDTNVPSKQRLTQLFGDYLPIPSTSLDFNRMQEYTREWSLLIEQMLIVAENMDQYTSVPLTMRKILRNDKLYLSAVYDNVNYLMAPYISYGAV